jgi:small nuclear ribonucleoprotein G
MSKPQPPELKKYMDKRLSLRLNANRSVTGVLRGFDHFMNLVLDDAVEDVTATEKARLGMVVRARARRDGAGRGEHRVGAVPRSRRKAFHVHASFAAPQVIRGNSVIQMECLDRV